MIQTLTVANIGNEKIEKMSFLFVFRFININKELNHSANKLCMNNDGKIFAVRCNCGKGMFHPMIGGLVQWEEKISAKNIQRLKKLSIERIFLILED